MAYSAGGIESGGLEEGHWMRRGERGEEREEREEREEEMKREEKTE